MKKKITTRIGYPDFGSCWANADLRWFNVLDKCEEYDLRIDDRGKIIGDEE